MDKVKVYILYGFLASLIGAVIEIISTVVISKHAIIWSYMFISMAKGALIGCVSIFFLFYVFMRFRRRPVAGILTNFTVVAILLILWTLFDFTKGVGSAFDLTWYVAFIMAEILSFILTAVWYRQMTLYNDKLGKKKASIESNG